MVAKETMKKEKQRREGEQMERLYRPRDTRNAVEYEATKYPVGHVMKVEGVLWRVAKSDKDGKNWWVTGNVGSDFPTTAADHSSVRPKLVVCGEPSGPSSRAGTSVTGASGPGPVDRGPCVAGTSPFSLGVAENGAGSACCPTTACSPLSPGASRGPFASAALSGARLDERPVRLPKVLPAVDVATANDAAAWVQAARLREQLECADKAAAQRLLQAKQQYYLSIGLLCEADQEAVKQRLQAVVQAAAARQMELEEQQAAQANLEAEIIAAQQVMQDVHADLEGKHAQGDSFGVQYAAEELKLAKYKVLLLLKQKRRLKAMVAIHECNKREADKAQEVAKCEFADAMARHEHARRVMMANHDLDDNAEDQLKEVQKQLQTNRDELQKLRGQLENTKRRREVVEGQIRDCETDQRRVLGQGLSAGQQVLDHREGGSAPGTQEHAVGLAGGAGPDLHGGADPDAATFDMLKKAAEAKKQIREFFTKTGVPETVTKAALLELEGDDAAEAAGKAADAEAKRKKEEAEREAQKAKADLEAVERKAAATIQTQAQQAQDQLLAQLHAIELGTQQQARQTEEVRTQWAAGLLGTDKLENRRDIANGVHFLMSLRFRVRRYMDEEVELHAKIAQVQQRIAALEDRETKLKARIDKEAEEMRGSEPKQEVVAVTTPATMPKPSADGCKVENVAELTQERKAAITTATASTKVDRGEVTVVMTTDPSDKKTLLPCYGRIVKRTQPTSTQCDFEWFFEGQLNKEGKPNGLGTFVCTEDKGPVQRLRGSWNNGKFDSGILEKWDSQDSARTEPPTSVKIGKGVTGCVSLADYATVTSPATCELDDADLILFEFANTASPMGTVKRGKDVVHSESAKVSRTTNTYGTLEYTWKSDQHLMCYWPVEVDGRTAAMWCWQWQRDGTKVSNVTVQVGTVVNREQPLAGSAFESGKNLLGRFTLGTFATVSQRAGVAGYWKRAVHAGIQCTFTTAPGAVSDIDHNVVGYDNGVLVRNSTGKMLCGLPHGKHNVTYTEGADFFGDCFNGCPSRGYVRILDTHPKLGAGGFWGTFLTPSAANFHDAWMQVSNTGRRSTAGKPGVAHRYWRQRITGSDYKDDEIKATDEAVKGATAASDTGLQSLPSEVFQQHARNNAVPPCGGAAAAAPDESVPITGGANRDVVQSEMGGGHVVATPSPVVAGGGDEREWDGGISQAWLQEANRRVDHLCADLERLRSGDLPPSAHGELGRRAVQYASTFADVLRKKPVCGPGLLRSMARKLAAALDASFSNLENAPVMAQLAAWFRLEC